MQVAKEEATGGSSGDGGGGRSAGVRSDGGDKAAQSWSVRKVWVVRQRVVAPPNAQDLNGL